jgi:hypothetical protein
MARDKNAQLRNLIAGYGDSMRLSDIKALIAVLFVAIMMLTVVQYRDRYPWYLSVPVILTPFMIIYLSLLFSVYPRFPRAGRKRSQSGAILIRRISTSSPTLRPSSRGSPRYAQVCRASCGGRTSRC